MAKLVYTPCTCITRGNCFTPGSRGNLFLVTKEKIFPVAKCRYCISAN